MPVLEGPGQLDAAQQRLALFLREQRQSPLTPDEPTEDTEAPGFGEVFAAAGRTMNVAGSLAINRVSLIMAGRSPIHGQPTNINRFGDFDSSQFLSDPEFYLEHPAAIQGYEQLAGAQDEVEFDIILQALEQAHEDQVTLSEAGGASNLTASLLVNVADPINLIPIGRAAKLAQGVGTGKLVRNITRTGGIAAAANVAQEEALHALQPGRPIDRIDADIAAAGMGLLFGGTIGFLASPNFRPSGAGRRFQVPTSKLEKVRKRVERAFENPTPQGTPPRNLVDPLTESEQTLRDLLSRTPDEDQAVSVLVRHADDEAGIAPDVNARLLREAEEHYRKAGHELTVIRHPLQDDYDALTPLERTLNDSARTLRQFSESRAAPATSKELARNSAEAMVQQGSTLFAKAVTALTPSRAFDKSLLDAVQLARRVLFYDGTVSKAAVTDPNYRGPVPAEALKDLYSVELTKATRRMREAYNPAHRFGLVLGRDEQGRVEVQTGKKMAAAFSREPLTYTDAQGAQQSIPAYGHYNSFTRHAVKIFRERKAVEDGLADAGPTNVPEPLEEATQAVRDYFATMRDLGDQVGLLPGERSLAEAEAKLDEATKKLDELLEQREAIDAEALDFPETADIAEQATFTSIPEAWHGRTLFDWGGKGLRAEGNGWITDATGRRAKTFDRSWLMQLRRINVGDNPALVRELRRNVAEFWEVRERVGKFWRTTHYLAPPKAVDELRGRLARQKDAALKARIARTEEQVANALARVDDVQRFIDNGEFYFTRRFLTNAVKNDKEGFVAWLKRSWQKARNVGFDPETGQRMKLAAPDRPIIDELRERLDIAEDIRTEGELPTELAARYEDEVDAFFQRTAEGTWRTLTQPEHAHGVEHAFTGGSPFKRRTLTLDESDPAASKFLDADAERVLNAYFHTVGGRIATTTAVRRARRLFGAAAADIETPEDMLAHIDGRFTELNNSLQALDRQAGTRFGPRVERDRTRAMQRLTRRLGTLEGRGLVDNTAGAAAAWQWAGRQALNLNYLALLGSQVLAAMNDAAALTIFADVTSLPRNVKYLTKAMLPLKDAPRRDLNLMRLAYESEHSRIQALGDVDFEDPNVGVGFGATRRVTAAISGGVDSLQRGFSELTLINSWNRYIKRAAAMIAMDRLTTNSKKLLRAQALIDQGVDQAEALNRAGLSRFDAANLREHGIDAGNARRLLDLIRRYGTDEDGRPLADLSPDELLDFKGIMLPDAGRWLAEEGDAARELYDVYLTAINTEVERATIITPSATDRPLINDSWWGRAVNQFQTFAFAWGNQIARPLAQRPAGKQVSVVLAYFGTGAIVDAIRNEVSGRRSLDETARLWQENPLGMTYSVVHTSGLSGWLNRPLGFLDRAGVGPGALLDNTTISRAAFQSRTFWGSLSPTADLIDRTVYGAFGVTSPNGMSLSHWHALRKSVPFQNWLGLRLLNRYAGVDPLITERMLSEQLPDQEPQP